MITNNDFWLLLILLLFIVGDKVTTYICVQGVHNNFPEADKTSIERNFMAKWLIDVFGNFWGNVIMAVCSLIIMWLILLGSKLFFIRIGHPQYLTTVIYCLIIILTFAIGNNTYYALKYNKII
jgi:lipopolysaccharide/colanic/teichoic acid biosynthesis glycosyltransferase